MRSARLLLLLLTIGCLSGCGSDGGSTGSGPVLVGTYRGPLNLTASAGPAAATQSGTIVIVVAPNQTVTVGSFPPVPLSGNSFTASTSAAALNGPTLTCPQGTFSVEGTFAGTSVSGTAFSNGIVCNGFAITFTGNYSATLQSQVPHGQSDADLLDIMRRAIQRALP